MLFTQIICRPAGAGLSAFSLAVPLGRACAKVRQFGTQIALLSLLVLSVMSNGCATAKPYTCETLPASWHARHTTNAQTLNLANLAQDSIPSDQIAVGDVIDINLSAGLGSDDAVSLPARVNDQGNVEIPYVGTVALGGLSFEEAESAIKIACIQGEIYRNPHVVVTMKQRKQIRVSVVGAVEEQGTYALQPGAAGLLNAISVAGGLSENAGTVVEVRMPTRPGDDRPGLIAEEEFLAPQPHQRVGHNVPVQTSGSKKFKIDLASLTDEDPKKLDLADGAVVMVEQRDPMPLHVMGLVQKPGTYDFPVGKNLHVLDAIAMAGGRSSLVADKVFIIRRRTNMPEPALIEVSMNAAKRNGRANLLLEPGDTVSIEQTPGTVILETIRVIGFTVGGSVF